MRWKRTKPGTERIICRFLWLPKTINFETRWLEYACIKQRYRRDHYTDWIRTWKSIDWVDQHED